MALTDVQLKAATRAIKRITNLRPDLTRDLEYQIKGETVEISTVRSKRRIPVAKATFLKTDGTWEVLWYGKDREWHTYSPQPHVSSIDEFILLITRNFRFWAESAAAT